MSYLDVSGFTVRSIMPSGDVALLNSSEPGFLDACLADWSDYIDSRLRKRYAVPFSSPPPNAIIRWLVKLVTRDAYAKRGFNPASSQDDSAVNAAAETALAELKEAADSKDGLFDLPLRADLPTSGVVSGGPRGYSETSPYVWTDLQETAGRAEDG